MKPEYTDDVIESLENTFGELENRESLADAVLSAAKNAVEDNIPDYLAFRSWIFRETERIKQRNSRMTAPKTVTPEFLMQVFNNTR